MNHIYKVVFCKTTGTFVAVAEYARAHGKKGSGSVGNTSSVSESVAKTGKYLMFSAISSAMLLMSGNVLAATGTTPTTTTANPLGSSFTPTATNATSASLGNNGTANANLCYFDTARSAVICGDSSTSATNYGDIALGVNATAKGTATSVGSTESNGGAVAMGMYSNATGQNAIAIGKNAQANNASTLAGSTANFDAIAIGGWTKASGERSTVLGYRSSATNTQSMALGNQATASAQDQIVIGSTSGSDSSFANTSGIVIGSSAGQNVKNGTENVAIGRSSGNNIYGYTNYGIGSRSGQYVNGSDNYTMGIESGSYVAAVGGIGRNYGLGYRAGQAVVGINNYTSGAFYGRQADYDKTTGAVTGGQQVFGSSNLAMGTDAGTYIGKGTLTVDVNPLLSDGVTNNPDYNRKVTGAITTSSDNNIAIGNQANNFTQAAPLLTSDNIAMGSNAKATGNTGATGAIGGSIAIGKTAKSLADNAVAIGTNANVPAQPTSPNTQITQETINSVAIGNNARVATAGTSASFPLPSGLPGNTMGGATAIGHNAQTKYGASVAIGAARANAINSIAIGAWGDQTYGNYYADTEADGSLALGNQAIVQGTLSGGAQAIGRGATILDKSAGALAIGQSSLAQGYGAVALGGSPLSTTGKGVPRTQASVAAADYSLALSSDSNVYAGSEAGIAIGYGSRVGEGTVTSDANTTIPTSVSGTTIAKNGIAIGTKAQALNTNAISVGTGNTVKAANSGAFGDPNIVNGTDVNNVAVNGSYAVGNNNIINSSNTFILGNNVNSVIDTNGNAVLSNGNPQAVGNTLANSVYLGQNTTAVSDKGKNLATTYAPNSTNTTTGGATGTINSATVNDITYGSDIAPFAGAVSTGAVTVGAAGAERRISNVAAGQIASTSTDAINGSQLYLTQNAIGNVAKSTATNFGGGSVVNPDGTISAPTYTTNKTDGTTVNTNNVGTALTNLNNEVVKPLTFAGDSGKAFDRKLGQQTNVKGGATGTLTDNNIGVIADGTDTLTVKLAKDLTGLNSANFTDTAGNVTNITGNGMTITPTTGNPVSLTNTGLNNGNNKIINVANGTNSNDAVNFSQLTTTNTNVANNTTAINNINSQVNNTYFHVNDGTNTKPAGNDTNLGAITDAAGAKNTDAIAAGRAAQGIGYSAIAVGANAKAQMDNSIAIGGTSNANGNRSVALGTLSQAQADYATALGNASTVYALGGTAVGSAAATNGLGATAVGLSSLAYADNSAAFGQSSQAYKTNSTAIGYNSVAVQDNAVALGSGSAGNRAALLTGTTTSASADAGANTVYALNAATAADKAAITATAQSTKGAISVGDAAGANGTAFTRQITDVAAGSNDADAVNVAQLKGVANTPLTFTGNTNNGTGTANGASQVLGSTLSIIGAPTAVSGLAVDSTAPTAGTYTAKNLQTVVTDGQVQVQMADNPVFSSVTIPNTDSTKTVSLTNTGLNNGGNQITNVASGGTTLTNAANIGDLTTATAAARTEVAAGTNIKDVIKTQGANGQDIYTVNAKGTTASAGSNAVTVNGTAGANNVTDYAVDLSQTSKDSLTKADTAMQTVVTQVNGSPVKTLNQTDNTANFVNGTGTTATASGDGITYNVNTTTLANNPNGTVAAGTTGNSFATAESVANAINGSGFTLTAQGQNGSLVKPGSAVDMNNTDGNIVVTKTPTATGTAVTYNLAKDIKVNSVGINNSSVTLGNTGLNNGGNTITNVAPGQNGTDAVNVNQLNAVAANAKTTSVVKGTNIASVTPNIVGNNTEYTINANGTTVTTGSGLTTTATDVGNNVTNYQVNLDDNTKASLGKADTALQTVVTQIDGKPVKTINQTNNTANFVTGDNMVLSDDGKGGIKVATAKDVNFNSVTTSNVTTSGLTVNPSSTINMGGNAINNVAAGTYDTDAVNLSQLKAAQAAATTKVAAGAGNTVNFDGQNTYTVSTNTDGITTQIVKGNVAAITAPITSTGGIASTAANPNSLATAGDVVNAVNNSGFNLTAQGTNASLVKPGTTVDMKNTDANIVVSKNATDNTVNYDLAKNVKVDSVGINNSAVKVDANGLNNGGNKITNVANGTAPTDAATVGQLTQVKAGDNVTVSSATGANGQTIYTVNAIGGGTKPIAVNGSTTVTDTSNTGNGNTIVNGQGTKVSVSQSGQIKVDTPMAYVGNTTASDTATPTNTVALVGKGDAPVQVTNVQSGVYQPTDPAQGISQADRANRVNLASGATLNNAANIGDLQAVSNNLQNHINKLGDRIDGVDKDAKAGISGAMAMAALPQAYIPGKTMISGGMASYNGQGAAAVGISKLSDNGRWVIKIQGTADTQGHAGGAIGAGFHW